MPPAKSPGIKVATSADMPTFVGKAACPFVKIAPGEWPSSNAAEPLAVRGWKRASESPSPLKSPMTSVKLSGDQSTPYVLRLQDCTPLIVKGCAPEAGWARTTPLRLGG